MRAAAVDKVFEHLHAAHDALARVVGRRQPSPAGTDPAGGDPPESGKRLQAAILRYNTLTACAPAAYQADAARHGIWSEAALRLTEEVRGAPPGYRPSTQDQLQEELERQAAALEEDIRHLRALLAADRKRAINNFWRHHAPDIAQRWEAVQGARELEAQGPSGLWNVPVPNTQTLLTEVHDVMFAVPAFWRELYDKRPVDLPGFQAVLSRRGPRVPEGAWAQVQQYSMQDLQSALDKADSKARVPTTRRPVLSRLSRHQSSGSWFTPNGPSSAATRRRCTGWTRTSGSAPRYRPLPDWRTTGPYPWASWT